MDRDRNLLFGVFAVQLKKATPSRIMAAAAAWAADQSKDLPEWLVELDGLSPADRDLILGIVEQAINAHDGDAAATLAAFGGAERAEQTVGGGLLHTRGDARPKQVSGAEIQALDSDTVRAVQESPGRYSHMSEYGRGGMGRVLLVHDEYLGRDIALKELMWQDAGGDQASPMRLSGALLARFLQEARVTGQLEHPSIVPVYELGHRSDGTLYYTMKLVRGETLGTAIQQGASFRDRIDLLPRFVDLCQAIAYAHSCGVIHRDIKPANIMVGSFGETVVLDWGLAKVRDRDDIHAHGIEETLRLLNLGDEQGAQATAYGEIMGTPVYMSPEQAQGRLDQIDERSDVYALGAVLYEILAGQPPFEGRSVGDTIDQVISKEPLPTTEVDSNIPAELEAIRRRAMDKAANKRYASAKDLADDVQRFLSGSLVKAYAYNPGQVLLRFIYQNRAVVGTAAAAAIVLTALTAVYFASLAVKNSQLTIARDEAVTQREEAEHHRNLAEQRSYISSLLLARTLIDKRDFTAAVVALEQTPPERRGWEWGYLLNRCHVHSQQFDSGGRLIAATYARDGENVLTIDSDGTVTIWNALASATDEPKPPVVHSPKFRHIAAVVESADGKKIATVSELPAIETEVWDTSSGELTGRIGNLAVPAINAGDFSPDGQKFVAGSTHHAAAIWRCDTFEQEVVLQPHESDVRCTAWSPSGRWIVVGTEQGTIVRWNAQSGQKSGEADSGSDPVVDVWFHPIGDRFVAQDALGRLTTWMVEPLAQRAQMQKSGPRVTSLVFADDGATMMTGATDGTISLWDFASGVMRRQISGHAAKVASMALSPDSKLFASASDDRLIKIWRWETGELLRTFEGHSDSVRNVRFGPDGGHVLSASFDGTAKTWAVESTEATPQLFAWAHDEGVQDVQWMDGGQHLVSVGGDGSVVTWDAANLKPDHALCNVCRTWMRGADLSADAGLYALNCAVDFALLDRNSDRHVQSFPFGLTHVCVAPLGDRVLGSDHGGNVMLIDPKRGETLYVKECHDGAIWQIEFSPDGETFFTASEDHSVRRWDTATGAPVMTFAAHSGPVNRFSISDDGQLLVTTSATKEVFVWDLDQGKTIYEWGGLLSAPTAVEFAPFDDLLMVGFENSMLRCWELASGNELLDINPRHRAEGENFDVPVNAVQFSQDGFRVALAYGDGTIGVLRALPWTVNLRTQFQLAAESTTASRPITVDIVATAPRLVSNLRAMRDMVRFEQYDQRVDNSVLVDGSRRARTLRRMRMYPGDRIVSINGQSVDAATFSSEVTTLITELRSGSRKSFEMESVGGGITKEYRAKVAANEREEVVLRLTTQETRQIVTLLSVGINSYEGALRAMQQTAAETFGGVYLEDDQIDGIVVADFSTGTTQEQQFSTIFFGLMDRIGLEINDRILSINGIYLESMADTFKCIDAMQAQIHGENKGQIVIDVERGSFELVRIIVKIVD